MPEISEKSESVAVVGGGISGLLAAYEAEKLGKKVMVFEGGNRFGGKIQTGALDGKAVNLGAEFIDSEAKNPKIIALCNELGVELIPATDQKTEQFHAPDGKILSGEVFHEMYKPLAEQIIADKQALIVDNKYTQKAQHLNSISVIDYLHELNKNANPKVDDKLLPIVSGAYAAESGNNPEKISALQFVNEASNELGSFLGSDCGYRVKGGTEELIKALKSHLENKGVDFVQDAKILSVAKNDGKFSLGFEKMPEEGMQKFDKIALALPAYALAKIEGLEALGMTKEEIELLKNTQYTNSSKFFVKVKDGVEVDNACMFSNEGFEVWTSEKGMMTFLVGGEKANEKKGIKLIEHCLESYAKAHGKKVDDIFEITPDKMVFGGADKAKPCYASPALLQAIGLGGLFGTMERMAEQGVALVGTFFPRRDAEGTSVGFMENGAFSAHRAMQLINKPAIVQEKEQEQSYIPSWVHKLFSGENSQSQQAGVAMS